MKDIYSKLNNYLNDICIYLEEKHSFLLDNIDSIWILNDAFLQNIKSYSLENKTVQNNLTFDDVYLLAREIIETIDKNYLIDFDNLIQSGTLDFSYDNANIDSHYTSMYINNELIPSININREFNYDDVCILIHEFIHYTNGKEKNYSENRNYFTEFLSIYFEIYTIEYLLKKGINKEELDYLSRIKILMHHSKIFNHYEIVLLAFVKFGNLDSYTVSLLQQYFCNINKELFDKECSTLYKNLCIVEESYKDEIEENPNMLGSILSDAFITTNYRYILGTLLAIYAYKYSNFDDIVYLNNHINDYNDKSVYDICSSIGIDLKSKDFNEKLFTAINEYMDDIQQIEKKTI